MDLRLRGLLTALSTDGLGDTEWTEYVAMTIAGPPPASWRHEDSQRYDATVRELGATMRRVEALTFEHRASDAESFDAYRVTVTHSDGTETADMVTIPDHLKTSLEPQLQRLLQAAETSTGSRHAARKALLALLAETSIDTHRDTPAVELDKRSGTKDGTHG